jgi:hypothetical protein
MADVPNPQAAASVPRPRLHLAVGVTGHRASRLDAAQCTALQSTIQAVLEQIGAAAQAASQTHAAVFSNEPPCLRLVSGLADGADSLAASAALQIGWRLDACLPFTPDLYAADFADGKARSQFNELLGRATAVFSLPGRRNTREAAYESAGRIMLEQSDIVLAVWDGDSARGRGGTAQIVAEAVARHVPVIHVDARGATSPTLLWSGLSTVDIEQPTLDIVPRADARSVIDAVTAALLTPPDNDVDRRMLSRFFAQRSRKRTPALPYPLLLTLAGVRRLRAADFRPQTPQQCADQLLGSLVDSPDTGRHGAMLRERLLPQFGRADAAANYFAQIFRSGFVANFTLAALAVLLAASGLLIPAFKLPLIGAELAVIFLILANTRAGRRAGWHERWMDDRHLAEQLRSLAVGSMLGNLDLRAVESRDGAVIPGWVRWLSRATAREMGLPGASVDQAYLERVRAVVQRTLAEQVEYQRSSAKQIRELDHRLHHAGEYLFGATIAACLIWIGLKVSGLMPLAQQWLDVTAVVTVLTATLPALGAAFYGIRMQGDFSAVAERSAVMIRRLERLQRAIEADPLDFARLASRLHRLSDIMLTDVANWRTTYQARPLTLPG